jgi:hypothetical protein
MASEVLYLTAFTHLSTTRALGEWGYGPIPWNLIAEYGDRVGLSGSAHDLFVHVLGKMDKAFHVDRAEQIEIEKRNAGLK